MADATLTITGNLTAAPDIRFTSNGKSVSNFSVASTPRVKVNGSWEDGETIFMRVTAWDKTADAAAELQKGEQVIVTGRLYQRSYTKDGDKKTYLEVTADTIGRVVRAKASSAPANDPWGSAEPPF